MISITDKHNCCGCEACVHACPKQCIAFNQDEEGFSYVLNSCLTVAWHMEQGWPDPCKVRRNRALRG